MTITITPGSNGWLVNTVLGNSFVNDYSVVEVPMPSDTLHAQEIRNVVMEALREYSLKKAGKSS